jgi:hypothetical protein
VPILPPSGDWPPDRASRAGWRADGAGRGLFFCRGWLPVRHSSCTCRQCGVTFSAPARKAAARKYCSRRCWSRATNPVGKTNSRSWPAAKLEVLRVMNREGFSDREIAAHFGITQRAAWQQRRKLGLSPNADKERHRQKISAAAKARFSAMAPGEHSRVVSEVQTRLRETFASRSGWPTHLPPRAVTILNLLTRVGLPMTRREVAETLGLCLAGTVTTHLYAMTAERLVLALPGFRRTQPHGGHRGNVPMTAFTLGPVALTILEERSKCATSESKA